MSDKNDTWLCRADYAKREGIDHGMVMDRIRKGHSSIKEVQNVPTVDKNGKEKTRMMLRVESADNGKRYLERWQNKKEKKDAPHKEGVGVGYYEHLVRIETKKIKEIDKRVPRWRQAKEKDIVDYIRHCLRDRRFFYENELRIVSKEIGMLPLKLKKAQDWIQRHIDKQRERGDKPVRVIILKNRRLGSSTLCLADQFTETIQNCNYHSVTIAHRDDSTQNLFDIIKRYYLNMSEEMRPMRKYSNKKELIFRNPDDNSYWDNPGLNSQLKVFTAGSGEEGAALGETIHYFLGSEVAEWNNGIEIAGNAEIAVPKLPGTTIIYESSGYGKSGFFRDVFYNALRKENDYTPIFVGFDKDEDCIIPATDRERELWADMLEAQTRGDEMGCRTLLDKIGVAGDVWEYVRKSSIVLNAEQIKWANSTYNNECHKSIMKFKNMYPLSPEDAFLYGSGNLFDNSKLLDMKARAELEQFEYAIVEDKRLVTCPKSEMKVWIKPQPKDFYIMSVDVGEGVGGDSSVIQVFNVSPFTQVLKFKSDAVKTLYFKEIAYDVAVLYNMAFTIIEANSMGIDVVNYFINRNYPNMFMRMAWDDSEKRERRSAGWKTTPGVGGTKWTLQAAIVERVERKQIVLNDPETIDELMGVVIDSKTGLASALQGKHDDEYIAIGLACVALKTKDQLQAYIERKRQERPVKNEMTYEQEIVVRERKRMLREKQAYGFAGNLLLPLD